MKKLNLIVIIIFVFSISSFSQTNNKSSVAVIDTNAFANKELGIPQLVQAYDKLESEFELQETEIKELHKKYKELWNFISASQKAIELTELASALLPNKENEFRKIDCEIKQKQEIAKAHYEKRKKEIIEPINENIGKVLREFAKQNGYASILDKKSIESSSIIIDSDYVDVTRDFIKFYNNYSVTKKTQ